MRGRIAWRGSVLDDFGISRTAFGLVSIPSVLGILTVMPPGISITQGLALWAAASIVSTGLLGLVLALSRRLRARFRMSARANAMFVLLAMLLAGAVRGFGVVIVFHLFGFSDRVTILGRITSSAVIFTVWLVLIGGFLSALSSYRAARQALLDEIVMRELQMRLFDEGRAADKRESAVLRLTETTEMVREILQSADVGSPDEYSRISLLLHRAIDERIRPLVHEMWFEPAPDFNVPHSTGAFIRKAFLSSVPLAWALALYAFIETTGAVVTLGWRNGVVAAVIEWMAFAAIVLGERSLRPRPGVTVRSLTICLLAIVPLLCAWFVVGRGADLVIPTFSLAAFVVTAPILTLTCCAARAVLDDRGPTLQELQARLERDDWAEQLETLERKSAENSMASVIHNTVQARLLAAALQLETAAMTNDEERATLALEHARAVIDDACLPTSRHAISPADRLASIAEAWTGIIDVETALDESVVASETTRLALDAIEECVANAARHASASVVEVSLLATNEGLEILVSDDGAEFTGEFRGGVGSDWMMRISAGRLTRTRTASGWNQVRIILAAPAR